MLPEVNADKNIFRTKVRKQKLDALSSFGGFTFKIQKFKYLIRPNYRPCPHNRPHLTFYFIFTYYRHLTIFFLNFYFILTYYRPLDNLLALVVENKFM